MGADCGRRTEIALQNRIVVVASFSGDGRQANRNALGARRTRVFKGEDIIRLREQLSRAEQKGVVRTRLAEVGGNCIDSRLGVGEPGL